MVPFTDLCGRAEPITLPFHETRRVDISAHSITGLELILGILSGEPRADQADHGV